MDVAMDMDVDMDVPHPLLCVAIIVASSKMIVECEISCLHCCCCR